MKKSSKWFNIRRFCKIHTKLYDSISFWIFNHSKIIALTVSIGGIIWSLYSFNLYNKVPNKAISIDLDYIGYVDSADCSIIININSKFHTSSDTTTQYNIVNLNHFNNRQGKFSYKMSEKMDYFLQDTILKKYKEILDKLPLDSLYSAYTIRYECSSNVKNFKSKSRGLVHNDHSYSYMGNMQNTEKNNGESILHGDGFVLFPNSNGNATISFGTSFDNIIPHYRTKWDYSQTNLHLNINTNSIKCKKLTLNFNSASKYSDIYPVPDIVQFNSVEFTSPKSISLIQREGLSLYAEFMEFKNMVNVRNLVLTSYLSIMISILCGILFNFIKS